MELGAPQAIRDGFSSSKSMKTSLRLIRWFVAVIVLMTASIDLLAQETQPIFRERFASAFDPYSRTYFSVSGTEGEQFGGQQPYASVGASHFTGSIDDAVTLYSGQLMMNYNGLNSNPAGTFGVQQRWMTVLPVVDTSIVGAGLYMDFTQSRYDNLFQQLNLNLELMTESAWVSRFNVYVPVGQIQQETGLGSVSGGLPGQLSVIGTAVGTGGINYQWMDVALMGTDLELGRKLFNYRAEVYAGYYNWNGPLAGFANGVKGGLRGYLTANLSGNVNVSHDEFFGTNVYGGLTYFFGGSGGSQPLSFANLMTLPSQRSQQVSVSNYVRNTSSFQPVSDTSGDPLHVYFVEEGGTGTGSQTDPSNVNAILANPTFGHGSVLVLLDSNGNITAPVGLTEDRQQVVGGGSTGSAVVDFSLALGQPAGTSVVSLTNLGDRPVLSPAAGNAVTLTDQNVVQGFTIDGSGGVTNGIAGHPGAIDTTIRDMVINNVTGTGILIQPSTNTTINSVQFSNNGMDVLLNAQNSTISNITSTNAVNGAISLGGGGGDITGTTQISNVTITGAGGFGGIRLNNAQNGAIINLTDVSVTGGTGRGVTVVNSQTGSIYNLTNVDTLNTGGNGFLLQNSNGTFNVNSTSSITDSGGAALAISGGSMDLNFAGTITQGHDASAVSVTGNHNGTATFLAGSSINTTLGNGLQFNEADGIYNFLGSIDMNGGDAGIDILDSNGAFTFNDPQINNTAGGIGISIIGGAGFVPLTTFNGMEVRTSGNAGMFVSNAGLTQVSGVARVATLFGQALVVENSTINMNFSLLDSDNSTSNGVDINSVTGNFDSAITQVTNADESGIVIQNSGSLTSVFASINVGLLGSSSSHNGVTLNDAGTVSILDGAIDGTTGDGINSTDTNLTVTSVDIGSGAVSGDGIEITNNGTAHIVNLSNNHIIGNAGGIATRDSGVAGELLLTLDGNTIQTVNSGSLAMSIVGSGLNSTIVQSMAGGTIIGGGNSGGVQFDQVTFDASGTALSGTQVDAGNWTIGTTTNRVQGDGLRFDAPTGNLSFATLNIANNGGTGLLVDTKTLGTTFTLGTGGGSIDTTGGAAMNLDPLTVNMILENVTSVGGSDGIILDGVAGNLTVTGLTTVTDSTFNGIDINDSSAIITFENLAISGAGGNGITASNLSGGLNVHGGFITDISGNGVVMTNADATISGLTLSHFGPNGIIHNVSSGAYELNLVNNTINNGGTNLGISVDASGTGTVDAKITGNTIDVGWAGAIVTTADAGKVVLDFSDNEILATSVGVQISGQSGGTLIVTNLADNVITGSTAAAMSLGGVTFDADTSLAGLQTVNGGDTTIGDLVTTTNVSGDGLSLVDVSGALAFGNLNIGNDSGTGLYVSTKVGATTFSLSNTGGSINTTSGSALYLDPLAIDLTFASVSSTNSFPNAISLDTVSGSLDIGTVNVTNTAVNGVYVIDSTVDVTINQLNIDGAGSSGVRLESNTSGSFTVTGTGGVGAGGTIKNVGGEGVLAFDNANTSLNNMVIDASLGSRGVSVLAGTGTSNFSLTNSTVTGGTLQGVAVGADQAGLLNATISGNTIVGTGNTDIAAAFAGVTSATGLAGGTLNLAFSDNTLSSLASSGAYISSYNPVSSTTGGTVTVTDFANNTVTQSNSSGSSSPLTGGIRVNGVTFDADLNTAGIQTVNGGTVTIGSVPSDVVGDGLQLNDVSGALAFTTMNIHNDDGTGLYVNTKIGSTTFSLSNTGGAIDTTNGAALFLDPLTADLTFSSVSSTNSTTDGITLDAVAGTVNLGNVTVTNAAGSGLSMANSTADVTAATVTINGAATGLLFGDNTGGSFTATGTTTISNVTGTGVDLNGAVGTYQFASLNVTTSGASTGMDFRNSNVLFTSGNTAIAGDGTAGSVGIDLSGSLNPNGANSTTSNIHLGSAAGQTATINSVGTGVLLGNTIDGSAGAYLVYGNQTPNNSGSQINADITLDTTHLTSVNGFTQGRYEFLGVGFTGIATFQQSTDLLFVGSVAAGTGDGTSPENRMGAAELLALDANPANLDGKTVVLVNDNSGAGIDLGANTLTLGENTTLDSFGNGQTFSTAGTVPVNVIVDTISGGVTFTDPNGAATLTNNGSTDLVTLGNSDTIQNLILVGGTNSIFGSSVDRVDINNNTISGASVSAINLNSMTGASTISQNAISDTGFDGILLTDAGTVVVSGGTIDSTGGDGIHSLDTNLTVTGIDIGSMGTVTGDGIEIVNSGPAHAVDINSSTITASASGISSNDSGIAGELLLSLDGNTLQSTGSGTKALSINASAVNSTIIQSMNGGTIIGNGTGGGAQFTRVTFDASGTALSGTQVDAGDWTIGNSPNLVQGDGLRFDDAGGNVQFGDLNIANNGGVGLYVNKLSGALTVGNASGNIETTGAAAMFLDPVNVNLTFDSVSSTDSNTSGLIFDTVSGSVSINDLTIVNANNGGMIISTSSGLTSTFQNVSISDVGSTLADAGVQLTDAGTVSILGGTIDGTFGDGIFTADTNLTVSGVTMGGMGTINGDGIEISSNSATTHTINLINNTITATASGISSSDSGAAAEIVLTLDGNTIQSTNSGSLAISITGGGADSTIIRSLNGGTVIGNGAGGGVVFNQVTFDGSGAALTGTAVTGGNWTIGTTANRVQGDGLRFDAPTGEVQFGELNIANNDGAGLYVDTKTLGTTFAMGSTGGVVDTTNGDALFLDPLTTNLNFSTVNSTNSDFDGITLDEVAGTINIGTVNVTNAFYDGIFMGGSSADVTIGQVNIDGADVGIDLMFNSGSFTVTGVGASGAGGTIQNVDTGGVFVLNTANTSLNNMVIDGSTGFGGMQGLSVDGTHSLTVTNSTIIGNDEPAVVVGADLAGVFTVTFDGNQITNTQTGAFAGGFMAFTSAGGLGGGEMNLAFDDNTISSADGIGVLISTEDPFSSSTGGDINITSFSNNAVTRAGFDGINIVGATFDSDLLTAGIQTVNAGTLTIGDTATPTNVTGNGLLMLDVSGSLAFTTLNIGNDAGDGLVVDTKFAGTTFDLATTGGTINTTNGAAMYLDPLTVKMTLDSVSSSDSLSTGITLDEVAGTLNIGTLNVSNSTDEGVLIANSSAIVSITNGSITGSQGGSFHVDGGTSLVTYGGSISNDSARAILIEDTTGGGVSFTGASSSLTDSGTGIEISGAQGNATFDFNSSSLTGGGILISGSATQNASGLFTFNNMALGNAVSGTMLQVTNNGTNRVTGTVDLNNVDVTSTDADRTVLIEGMGTGGTVDFDSSSTISATGGVNNGILVQNNDTGTGKTITFGGLITATTGTSNAIDLLTNTNTTINFNGGMAINTTTGTAFNATGGGIVNLSGAAANTIGATTASQRTAVNIANTTIGAGGVTFQSISVNEGSTGSDTSAIILDSTGSGNFAVTGVGGGSSGAQGGNGTGGSIANVTDVDAISLNDVGGTVTLSNMSITNIVSATDATDAIDTLSGVDAIQGSGNIGGLSLVGVTIDNTSDMIVNGAAGSTWGGLNIDNSILTNSNRYAVADRGDGNNEAMVQIYGLNGTASVTNSKLDGGAILLDLMTQTTGHLDFTATNNEFSNTWKGFDNGVGGIYQVGSYAVRLQNQGSATMTAIVGDVNEVDSSQGNLFLNDLFSFYAGHVNSTDTGLIKVLLSENTFQVTEHQSPTGAPSFTLPYGSVLLTPRGAGGMYGTVSNNTFDQTFDAAGLAGSLSVAVEGGADNQFRLTGNNFINPWDRAIEVRVNNGATATALVSDNTYATSTAGGGTTDSTPFTGPYDANRFWTLGGSTLNLTYADETVGTNESANSVLITTTDAGDTLNMFLSGVHAANGYIIGGLGTNNLFRNGSVSATIEEILQDNDVLGGLGDPLTAPPVVSPDGTINFTNTPVPVPGYTIP